MSEFLAMGGYAAFVWPSYALAAFIVIGLLISSLRSMRRNEKMADRVRRPRAQAER